MTHLFLKKVLVIAGMSWLAWTPLFAQLPEDQSILDSLRRANSWAKLQQVVVGLEGYGPLRPLFCGCGSTYSLDAQMRFNRFVLGMHGGYASRQDIPLNFGEIVSAEQALVENYQSSGFFFRVGGGVRLDPVLDSRHTLPWWMSSLGMGYARAFYTETFSMTQAPGELARQRQLQLGWVELYFDLRVAVWRDLLLGHRIQFAFGRHAPMPQPANSFYAPGFGRLDNGNRFVFHYFLAYRFPLTKKRGR